MTKRKKKRLNRKIIYILLVLILLLIAYKIINNNRNNYLYDEKSVQVIKEKKLDYILKWDYSKTLDEVLKNNSLNVSYIEEYTKINYIESEDFLDKVNTFLNKGYNGEEINNIIKLSKKNQDKLLNLEKKEFSKYLGIKNFNIDNLERYNSYSINNSYELENIVTYVNINLDKSYYTDTIEATDPDSLLVLVNKYNYLPNNYKPSDLTYVDGAYGNQVPFRKILKDDFIDLQTAAKKEININLMPTTAFRDQSFQTTLYNNYVKSDGKEKADTYSARPGYSEHQTGLAIDLKNTALNNGRLTDENFEWLNNNAYKYGFIIRYPKNKDYITGYEFENWHIRYVGKEHAKIIHDNNLTLEEYIDLYIEEY